MAKTISVSPAAAQGAPVASEAADGPSRSPLYQQIKALIVRGLQDGAWKPGELMPSEMDLAARYGVSQGTVRKALDDLAADSLVVRRQGKGTYVATHTVQQFRYRFLRLKRDAGADGRAPNTAPVKVVRNIIAFDEERASAGVAGYLRLKAGAAVLYVRRVLSFAGVATILEDIWLPACDFAGLTAQRMRDYPGPTYGMFELEFGVRMVRAEEKLRAVAADEEQARLLEVAVNAPLLSVERLAYTYADCPMELRKAFYCTDHCYYSNELN